MFDTVIKHMANTFYAWNIAEFAGYHVVAVESTVSRAQNNFMSVAAKVSRVNRKRFKKHTLYASVGWTIHLNQPHHIACRFYYCLTFNFNKKSPANAKGNEQQWYMFESPVKQSQVSHQRAPYDQRLIIYSVLLVLTRRRDLSRTANTASAGNRKFSLPHSHLAPTFGVTSFEFMVKLYGSWN